MLVWFSPCFTTGVSFLFVYFGKVLLWIAFGVFMVNFVESKKTCLCFSLFEFFKRTKLNSVCACVCAEV